MSNIRLAENFRGIFYAPFYAAQALQFYAREGVDVELLSSSLPGAGASAVLDGTLDITWGGPMRVIKAHEEQPTSPLVCFCEVVVRDPFYLVGRNYSREFELRDLLSLKFAAVAEVPTPWMCLQHDMRDNGIDPAKLNRAPERSMVDNFEALCSGQLDVVQVLEPYASMALRAGVGTILYDASARGPTLYTTFITTRDRIERHRTAFIKMARAIRRVQDWLAVHSAEELAEIVQSFFPDVMPQILVKSLRRYEQTGIWRCIPGGSRKGFTRLAESLVSGRFIARMPTYESCVDQSL
jgi:NitT/TauT family transport system substrate-binding protein